LRLALAPNQDQAFSRCALALGCAGDNSAISRCALALGSARGNSAISRCALALGCAGGNSAISRCALVLLSHRVLVRRALTRFRLSTRISDQAQAASSASASDV
jgi:hypothetical protein